jgi:hypothetical protein
MASDHFDLVPTRLAFSLLVHRDVPAVLQLLEAIYRYTRADEYQIQISLLEFFYAHREKEIACLQWGLGFS